MYSHPPTRPSPYVFQSFSLYHSPPLFLPFIPLLSFFSLSSLFHFVLPFFLPPYSSLPFHPLFFLLPYSPLPFLPPSSSLILLSPSSPLPPPLFSSPLPPSLLPLCLGFGIRISKPRGPRPEPPQWKLIPNNIL